MKQAFAFAKESHRSKCTRILQLFYHFIQMLVRIFTKSLKASLKAPPYFENIQQQRNRKQITALEQVHRSQLQVTPYLPSGWNYLSSPLTAHLNSTGGKEWIICKAPLSNTTTRK